MKRKNILLAAVIIAAVFGFRGLFPDTANNIKAAIAGVFSRDIDYKEVFSDLGNAVPAFLGREEKEEDYTEVLKSDESFIIDYAQSGGERLMSEMAMAEGEEPISLAELPDAVAAFLESQQQYADLDLPENVSYEYLSLPFEKCAPVAGYNSSGFGYRTHPIHGDVRFHYGTDFAAWSGENIYAFADGVVTHAGWSDSYGNYITIEHSDGWESLYAHCSILYVENGDAVCAGDKIALVGDTGMVTGPHLHFELSHEGIYTNPEYYWG
ncbi:MAG: M23 family metallopeptidase [Oscillospiraceae bacterium]|nr:M23 family metallopeptidase [Oscillospiraceae bacterium]